MTFRRFTVREAVRFEGLGLHSGAPVHVRIHPHRDGLWLHLGADRVALSVSNVTDVSRCTRVGSVSTVEHLMSALAGQEITDAVIETSAPELPGLDGSALPYAAAIQNVGREPTGSLHLDGPFARIFVRQESAEISVGRGEGHLRYEFTTEWQWIQRQTMELTVTPETYLREVAPARTFCFESELPYLKELGLGQGLDGASAFAIGASGYVGSVRFPDEPVRHKLLDLIGDLYLSGVPIAALGVVASRSGHRANVEAAHKLAAAVTLIRSDEPYQESPDTAQTSNP